ncbi:MAG: type II secretion system F family protein [Acidobacteria bacterium]|nr:type II secretion system F family protein [Acidobacteriota bacterium]
MAIFFYKAIGKAGSMVEGTVDDVTDKAVAFKLQGMGLIPIEIATRKTSQQRTLDWSWRPGGLSAKEVMFFTQELSTLVNAGLPLDRSLAICKQLSDRPRVQAMVDEVLQGIKQGKTFADSLASYPKVFSKLYINMVRAGEASGSLPLVLERLVEFQQSADELKSYLISSLIYPALLVAVGGASIVVLLNYVVPKFATIFEDAGQALPLPTQILLSVSDFTKSYWWVFLLGLGGAWAGFTSYTRTEKGRLKWDKAKLRMLLLGRVLQKIEVGRMARTLGTLVHNAVPLIQALNIVRDISNNRVISKAISDIADGVKKGEGVGQPMQRTGVFPSLAVHLIEVGEETGRLDVMLLEISKVYDKEVRAAIKNLVALFEPAMILVMGLLVGIIVVSMMLAIVSINDVPL